MTSLLSIVTSLFLLLQPAPPPSERARVSVAPAQPSGPIVVLVHGRGELGDTASFRQEAGATLAAAIRDLGTPASSAAPELRVVWYADLLGERGGMGSADEERACAQRRGEAEPLGLLTIFATSLLDLTPSEGESSADTRSRQALRSMLGDARFLGSPVSRCVAEGRVGRALETAARDAARGRRPVVLVAHSMGGLLAWGHLQARGDSAAPALARLVTLGSPVGSTAIRTLLFGDRSDGAVSLPRGVRSWVNVVNANDPFAVPLLGENSALVPQAASAPLRDVHITGGNADAHALLSYLRDPATARAILDAMR